MTLISYPSNRNLAKFLNESVVNLKTYGVLDRGRRHQRAKILKRKYMSSNDDFFSSSRHEFVSLN